LGGDDGKYKREIEVEEEEKRKKLAKAQKLEKSWELMRICKEYIKENSKVWENEEEIRLQKRNEEERKMERIRRVALKKGKIKER